MRIKTALVCFAFLLIVLHLNLESVNTHAQPPSPTLYDPGDVDNDGNYSIEWSDVSSHPVETLNTSLPIAVDTTSAIWDGKFAYIFGGQGNGEAIVRFDPFNETVITLTARLNPGREGTSAIWDGQYAYIFGGWAPWGSPVLRDDIIRFDPVNDTATKLNVTLPSGRERTSAVWNGQFAYIFGGSGSNEIIRFDPKTENVTKLNVSLPTGRDSTSAFWDGQYAYIFGGHRKYNGTHYHYDEIIRFDPITEDVTVLDTHLPSPIGLTSAVWTGQYAYIFGGSNYPQNYPYYLSKDILKFDPLNNTVSKTATFSPRADTSAIWNGKYAYIFGGYRYSPLGGERLDDIVNFDPYRIVNTLEEDDNPEFTTPSTVYYGYNNHFNITNKSDGIYYYRVNASHHVEGSSSWNNTVSMKVVHKPRIILSPSVISKTDITAVIVWTTDKLSDSLVEYGNTTSYNKVVSDTELVTSHSIVLTGLSPGTIYHYRVSSTDIYKNSPTVSSDFTFETNIVADKDPPEITSGPISYETNNSATIIWKTHELSDSAVNYGTTDLFGTIKMVSSHVIDHAVTLTNLNPGTLYYYQISSTDPSGNVLTLNENYSFTTDSVGDLEPPDIINGSVSVSDTSAIISWVTDEPSTSVVDYGLTDYYGSINYDNTHVTFHNTTIVGLTPETTYHFRINSVDVNNNGPTISSDYNFTTTVINNPPLVSAFSLKNGDTISGTVRVTGNASDFEGTIVRIEIKIDYGVWQTITGTSDWLVDLDTTALENGYHIISLRAWDGTKYSEERMITVDVQNKVEPTFPLDVLAIALTIVSILVTIVLSILFRAREKEEHKIMIDLGEENKKTLKNINSIVETILVEKKEEEESVKIDIDLSELNLLKDESLKITKKMKIKISKDNVEKLGNKFVEWKMSPAIPCTSSESALPKRL